MHKDNIIKRVKLDKIQEYLDQGFRLVLARIKNNHFLIYYKIRFII